MGACDGTPVVSAEGAVLGRVSTLAIGAEGVELMSTEGADPPIETALALAKELAAFKGQDVDVVDPAGLWRPDWGDLEDRDTLSRSGLVSPGRDRRAIDRAWAGGETNKMRDSALDDPATASSQEDGIVACTVYADGRKVAETSVDQLADWHQKPNHVVWVGLFEPSEETLTRLRRQLGLHPLAVLDAGRTHNHPKLEQYDETAFIVARTAQIVDDRTALGETQIFVGRGFVVSIRYGASIPYAEVRKRCEACPELLSHGEDYIVYSILEFIVANYDPVIEKVRAGVSEIEDQVLKRELPHDQIERLYRLRRNLLKLRDAITPLLDVCRRLESSDVVAIDPEMQMRFRQTTHLVDRTRDDIDSLREVLSFTFEVSLMMGQSRQTHVQSQQTVIARQLAAWAAILAVPTAIAGIYGMNFKNMPELEWRYGYFLVLAVIVLSCAGLYGWFRRNDWL